MSYNLLHTKCGSSVTENNVSEGYKYFCPECEEDLFTSETGFERDGVLLSYSDLVKYVEKGGLSVKQGKNGCFSGWFEGEKSSLDFDSIEHCYLYCYDFIKNDYKPL